MNYIIKDSPYVPFKGITVYNLTPDNLELQEVTVKSDYHFPKDHVWENKPPKQIHSMNNGEWELNEDIGDIKYKDLVISVRYSIGNVSRILDYYAYKPSDGRYIASATLEIDDFSCDNGFYVMTVGANMEKQSSQGGVLAIKKFVKNKDLHFTKERKKDEKVIVKNNQIEFIHDQLLKNKDKLLSLYKEVKYDFNDLDSDKVPVSTLPQHNVLWSQEQYALHCSGAEPFDFAFPHKYTAAGLKFIITATVIVDEHNKKSETYTFEVDSVTKNSVAIAGNAFNQ